MLAYLLLALGMACRFITHAPNFTPVIAIALFSGVYVNKKYSIMVPIALMVITDLFLGSHNVMYFTWGSVALIALMGTGVRKHKSIKTIAGGSILSAIAFFVITNLGVWLVSGMYPLTLDGLAECFTLAIPFFRNTFISTLVYAAVMFGAYELIAMKVKNTRTVTNLSL